MNVELWSKSTYTPRRIEALLLWSGDLSAVPSVGDLVEPFDGWSATPVLAVFWCFETKTIIVEIGPDVSGEYRAELDRRGPPDPWRPH